MKKARRQKKGGRTTLKIAHLLDEGKGIEACRELPQVAYAVKSFELRVKSDFMELHSFEECQKSKRCEAENYHVIELESNKIESAIGKAILAVEGRKNPDKAAQLTNDVEEHLRVLLAGRRAHSIPAIEERP